LLAEQTQWDGGHHPCIPKARGLADDQVYSLFTMSDITQGKAPRANSSTLPRNAAGNRMSRPARTSRETKMRKMIQVPKALVEPDGIEPTTSCLQSTRSPN
jgi:hypothetical protein